MFPRRNSYAFFCHCLLEGFIDILQPKIKHKLKFLAFQLNGRLMNTTSSKGFDLVQSATDTEESVNFPN
ncbi:hypothetical protein IWX85_003842 [Polaromonas sp. CG_9.11]|nr:hypothetical protein [Polaromonas sp. CG_9.11]